MEFNPSKKDHEHKNTLLFNLLDFKKNLQDKLNNIEKQLKTIITQTGKLNEKLSKVTIEDEKNKMGKFAKPIKK